MNADDFRSALRQKTDRSLLSSLEACVRCGICTETCHYYQSDPQPQFIPAVRAEAVRKIWKGQFLPARVLPFLYGVTGAPAIEELKDIVFGSCTMCGRCTLNCPVGVDTAAVVRAARGVLADADIIPEGLKNTVDDHLRVGNNMAISREDFAETVEWIEEQLQDEVGDPQARITIDREGAAYLYTMNPRELKFYPLSFLAAAKIFYAAGADWTISSKAWDVTNYALFSGEDEAAREIAGSLFEEALRLGAKEVIMAECGHGYRSFRWEGEQWLEKSYPFTVRSFVELEAEWIQNGTVRVRKIWPDKVVTYHDSCNLTRNGGIVNEPRYILNRVVEHFEEMTPCGVDNYCCGGGGGMLSMTEYSARRLAAGRIKAQQVAGTGAQVLATACHNCIDQLSELNKHYKLGVKVLNLCEIVAEALDLENGN